MSDINLSNKTLESQKSENYENENEDEDYEDEDYENKNEYEYENKNEYGHKSESENEDDDDKTIDQNKIKGLNDILDEIIDKSKSFKEQIKLLKKSKDLKGYWPYNDYDNKELKFKYFKIQLADMSNKIDERLFEQIFGHALIKLTDKLINTTDKEENQMTVINIEKSKDKLFKKDEFRNFVIQAQQLSDLKYTIDLILDFNEKLK